MREICQKLLCTGCAACFAKCPAHCIKMIENEEGFLYPSINNEKCLNCNLCKDVCPINKTFDNNKSQFFYGWNRDKYEIMLSSSGGIFRALANFILENDGVVIGVQLFPERYYAKHVAIYNKADLNLIKYSKYFQSDNRDSYNIVKKLIENNIYVLYSGTACQVAGLKSYIGNSSKLKYLYTVDVLCHGVGSGKAVKKYIDSKQKYFKKKIVNYQFRVKELDHYWKNGGGTSMKLFFNDGSYRIIPCIYDTYFVGFNENLILRESCYHCKFAGSNRCADLTLADYWGAREDIAPRNQYIYGISAFTINTLKGNDLIKNTRNKIFYKSVSPLEIVSHNLSFIKPQNRPSERDYIYKMLDRYNFDFVIHKLRFKYYIKNHIKDIAIFLLGLKRYNYLINKIKLRE